MSMEPRMSVESGNRAFGADERAGDGAVDVTYPSPSPRGRITEIRSDAGLLEFFERLADEIDRRQKNEGHSRDMSRWAELVAMELDLDEERQWACSTAARVHALGKLLVPEAIWNKKGPLTPEEWELVQSH